MPNHTSEAEGIATRLLALVEQARDRSRTDPFGSPVLAAALAIMRQMDTEALTLDQLEAVVRHLRDNAFAARAARLGVYVGGLDGSHAAMAAVAARLIRPDPDDSPVPFRTVRASVERTRFAAVFTAHPTFSMPRQVGDALARAAGGEAAPAFASHRPSKPTLEEEFDQATAAISRGRDAVDALTTALLQAAAATWPDRWRTLTPKPVIMTTWVGYDTDGRTDIGWWDTLRLRLVMKRLQLDRARRQVGNGPAADRLDQALAAVDAQVAACPTGQDADQVAAFAAALVGQREAAMVTAAPVLTLLDSAVTNAAEPVGLAVARAGLASHGLSLAHTHVRLNAAQLHNAARVRLGLADPPADASRRRVLLAAIGEALDAVQPEPVGLRCAHGRAGVRRAGDDDGGAGDQAHRRRGARPLPDRGDRERLHAAHGAVAGAAVRDREADRDQPAVRDGGGAGERRARAGGGSALAALVRLPARDRAYVPAVRLLRQWAVRRPVGGVLPHRAAAAEGGGAAGQARADRRGNRAVRHRR